MLPQNYDSTEELRHRIQSVFPRTLFIFLYALNRDGILIPAIRQFLTDRGVDKELGDNFEDAILLVVEERIQNTHLSKAEANQFSKEMSAKMIEIVEQKSRMKSLEVEW